MTPKTTTTLNTTLPPLGGRLRAIGEAHNAALLTLPAGLVDVLLRQRALAAALSAAKGAEKATETAIQGAKEAVVAALTVGGPVSMPSAPVLVAAEQHRIARLDAELLGRAYQEVSRPIDGLLVRAAPGLRDALEASLLALLAESRPAAARLRGLDWGNVDAVHELSSEDAAAFHALQPLAAKVDLCRQAALGLFELVNARWSREYRGEERIEPMRPTTFAGYGLTGEGREGRPYRWNGDATHPVQRLTAACLADPPETHQQRQERLAAEQAAREAEREATREARKVQVRAAYGVR